MRVWLSSLLFSSTIFLLLAPVLRPSENSNNRDTVALQERVMKQIHTLPKHQTIHTNVRMHILVYTAAMYFFYAVDGAQGLIRPRVSGASHLYGRCFGNRNIAAIFNTQRLHLRLVRALQIASGYQECFIRKACDFLQSGRPQVLNRGLPLNFEVLQWSKLVEICGTQNATKIKPQLNVCTSLADSYGSPHATTTHEIQERS